QRELRCASIAPSGSFCSMESSWPKQIGGPAHAGPRQIARPKGGGSGGLRAHRHEVSDTVTSCVKPFRRLRAHQAPRILRTSDTDLALLTQIVDVRLKSVGE